MAMIIKSKALVNRPKCFSNLWLIRLWLSTTNYWLIPLDTERKLDIQGSCTLCPGEKGE